MSRQIKEIVAAAIVMAIVFAIAAVTLLPTIASAAPAAASLPSITSVQPAVRGGLLVWMVSFSDGSTCDIMRPLTATLAGAQAPVVGQVRSFSDSRVFIAGMRMWGEVNFTDRADVAHVGY